MNIRLANGSDFAVVLDLVSKLLVELGGSPLQSGKTAPVFNDLITQKDVGFVVLGETDRAVAVCTVSFLQALRSHGRYAIVQEMYVEPEVRSTGIGAAVLHLALGHAIEAGSSYVELGAPLGGIRQVQFYERSGFIRKGERLRWKPPSS